MLTAVTKGKLVTETAMAVGFPITGVLVRRTTPRAPDVDSALVIDNGGPG